MTSIWDDEYFANLSQLEQRLYLWLIINPLITYYGYIEVAPAVYIARKLHSSTDAINRILAKFEKEKIILRGKDKFALYVRCFIKHQNKSPFSRLTIKSFESDSYKLPQDIKEVITADIKELIGSELKNNGHCKSIGCSSDDHRKGIGGSYTKNKNKNNNKNKNKNKPFGHDDHKPEIDKLKKRKENFSKGLTNLKNIIEGD